VCVCVCVCVLLCVCFCAFVLPFFVYICVLLCTCLRARTVFCRCHLFEEEARKCYLDNRYANVTDNSDCHAK
jgi:hypothetical protein